jgi:hypothetical protein
MKTHMTIDLIGHLHLKTIDEVIERLVEARTRGANMVMLTRPDCCSNAWGFPGQIRCVREISEEEIKQQKIKELKRQIKELES